MNAGGASRRRKQGSETPHWDSGKRARVRLQDGWPGSTHVSGPAAVEEPDSQRRLRGDVHWRDRVLDCGRRVVGVVFGLVAVAAAFALMRWRCEIPPVRGAALASSRAWCDRGRARRGGYSWRRDLKEVAAASIRADGDRWRSYEVEMVTAVFPVRWLRAWGFEISDCGPLVERVYSAIYRVKWIGWWLAACMRSSPRPRYRKRSCVRARHRMGPWMDIVAALPDGLRESQRDREFSLTR